MLLHVESSVDDALAKLAPGFEASLVAEKTNQGMSGIQEPRPVETLFRSNHV
jgi:hypothetical protein